MVVDHQQKFIFIHVYKTAGSSIVKALGSRPLNTFPKHVNFHDLPTWRHHYFSFGFVRNPWDRFVSSYGYLLRRNRYSGTFASFIKHNLNRTKKGKEFRQDIVVRGCSFVGRFEHLQDDFNKICKLAGITPKSLPRINISTHKPYAAMYTPELRQIVSDIASKDIDEFGFSFETTATKNIGDLREHKT